jgi:hypothetical protein
LISSEICKALPEGFQLISKGTLKGKHQALDVYQLASGPRVGIAKGKVPYRDSQTGQAERS